MPSFSLRRPLAGLAALGLAALGVLVVASPASADDDVTVTTQAAFEAELALANATADPDIIRIDAAGTWNHASVYTITQPLQIIGPGSTLLELHSTTGEGFTIVGALLDLVEVSITGLTITSAPGGYDGIDAVDADLVLSDVDVDGSTLNGIDIHRGEFVATGIKASNVQSVGINADAVDVFDITNVVASFNGARAVSVDTSEPGAQIRFNNVFGASSGVIGIFLDTDGAASHVDFEKVEVTDSGDAGMYLAINNNSTFDLNDLQSRFSNVVGIQLNSGGSIGTLTNSLASNTIGVGMHLNPSGAGEIAASGLFITNNATTGLELDTVGSGYISVTDSDIVGNDATFTPTHGGGILADILGSRGVLLDDVRVSHNKAGIGGGIGVQTLGDDATLEIRNSDIFENESTNFTDAGAGFAVVSMTGTSGFSLHDSTVRDNDADGNGGGIWFGPNDETIDGIAITRTTISGNEAGAYGGLYFQDLHGIGLGTPSLLIDSSTISGNQANVVGALGIQESFTNGTASHVDIVNTTISGNLAGGAYNVILNGNGSTLTRWDVRHSTITRNTVAGGSGGVESGLDADVVVTNSIIAGTIGGASDLNSNGGGIEVSYSLIGLADATATAAVGAGTGNLPLGTDPELGPLALNGGPTRTHLLLPGSAAINAGDPAIVGAPALDQRGLARIQDGRIDIGATEVQLLLAATGGTVTWPLLPLGAALLLAGAALAIVSRTTPIGSRASGRRRASLIG
jgi:hypothetical protein